MNTNTQALREALEPFAKLFQALQSKHDGPMPTTFEAIISTEDVRRAAYAFADLSNPPAPEQPSGRVMAWVIPGAECDDRGWIPAKAWTEDEFTQPLYAEPKPRSPRFAATSCSQCGGDFGPGNAGFSHCEDHAATPTAEPVGEPHELDALLPEIAQLIDAVKVEWEQQGCWSEWDQSVRDRISNYHFQKMGVPLIPVSEQPVPHGVLTAIRSAGLTLLKNQSGYELRNLGKIEALSASPAAPEATKPGLVDCGECATQGCPDGHCRKYSKPKAAKPEQQAQAGEPQTLAARLRNTPNWMRESYGNWKDGTMTYDRAPFEAADALEENERLHNEVLADLDIRINWLEQGITKKDAALKACVEALKSAKAAIKGREHTGFIDAAITQAEGAMK